MRTNRQTQAKTGKTLHTPDRNSAGERSRQIHAKPARRQWVKPKCGALGFVIFCGWRSGKKWLKFGDVRKKFLDIDCKAI